MNGLFINEGLLEITPSFSLKTIEMKISVFRRSLRNRFSELHRVMVNFIRNDTENA